MKANLKHYLYVSLYAVFLAIMMPVGIWAVQTYVLDVSGTEHSTAHLTNIGNRDEALRTSFSGTSAPSSPTPLEGQPWWHTTNDVPQWYDGAAWKIGVLEDQIQTLTLKTLTAPVLSGTATGTYTLGGTPTITAPALSGTVTGTYTMGGTPTIASPTFSGTTTGTYTISGTPTLAGSAWPCFSVGKGGTGQDNITGEQKITWPTEEFDTNSDFASDRFTPTVAGKYVLAMTIRWNNVVAADNLEILLYKTGSAYRGNKLMPHSTDTGQTFPIIVDADGSSDYFEVFAENTDRDTSDINGLAAWTHFSGCRVG